jgi:hypothetical protein
MDTYTFCCNTVRHGTVRSHEAMSSQFQSCRGRAWNQGRRSPKHVHRRRRRQIWSLGLRRRSPWDLLAVMVENEEEEEQVTANEEEQLTGKESSVRL